MSCHHDRQEFKGVLLACADLDCFEGSKERTLRIPEFLSDESTSLYIKVIEHRFERRRMGDGTRRWYVWAELPW